MCADDFVLTWIELNMAVMSEVAALTVMEKMKHTTVHFFSFIGWEKNNLS